MPLKASAIEHAQSVPKSRLRQNVIPAPRNNDIFAHTSKLIAMAAIIFQSIR